MSASCAAHILCTMWEHEQRSAACAYHLALRTRTCIQRAICTEHEQLHSCAPQVTTSAPHKPQIKMRHDRSCTWSCSRRSQEGSHVHHLTG